MRFLAMAALLLIGVVANGACAQVPQRNILLIIADDYGIDATRFYPRTDRRVTTPPAPATPNLAQLAAGWPAVPQCQGAAQLLADPVDHPDRALRLPHGDRQAGAEGPERDGARLRSRPSSRCPRRFKAFEGRPALAYHLAHIGKWHLSRGINDPRLQGWDHFSGPHPKLAGLDNYYTNRPSC